MTFTSPVAPRQCPRDSLDPRDAKSVPEQAHHLGLCQGLRRLGEVSVAWPVRTTLPWSTSEASRQCPTSTGQRQVAGGGKSVSSDPLLAANYDLLSSWPVFERVSARFSSGWPKRGMRNFWTCLFWNPAAGATRHCVKFFPSGFAFLLPFPCIHLALTDRAVSRAMSAIYVLTNTYSRLFLSPKTRH